MKLLFVALFFSFSLYGENPVDQKINVAIEFAQAGRLDLASSELQALLQRKLAPAEEACVLYNIAVLSATSGNFWEATLTLNKIDDDLYDKVLLVSPQQAMQIAYDGAIFSLAYAKKAMQAASFTQDEFDRITKCLESARRYKEKLESLAKDGQSASTLLTTLQEKIQTLATEVSACKALMHYAQLNKTDLLDTLGALLEEQFLLLEDLYLAANANESSLALYMQAYSQEGLVNLMHCIDRLLIFLQAPAKPHTQAMHAFLAAKIRDWHLTLSESYKKADVQAALSMLNMLANAVLLVQQEVAKKDVEAMLASRVEIAAYMALAEDARIVTFWQNQWQLNEKWARSYLEKKISLSKPFQAALLTFLLKRLNGDPIADKSYWQLLSENEDTTYLQLATSLHGASKVDYLLVRGAVEALRDRVTAMKVEDAISPLEAMLKTDSPILLFQDLIISWFFVDPQAALSFMFGVLADEINSLHLDPTRDSFIQETDYQLTMHLLNLITAKQKNGMLSQVYGDLMHKLSWFTAKNKKDLDFFTMSLELSWLKQILTEHIESIETITNAVDFGVDFQKKTMILLRYSHEPEFPETLDRLSSMQSRLVSLVYDALQALPTKGPKITKVIELIDDAKTQIPSQSKELASMQAVQDDLEQASKILHSLKSESQENQPKSGQSQKNQELSSQMQNHALKLSPELSIRLLQEMEKEDKSLQTQIVPQATGTRPW